MFNEYLDKLISNKKSLVAGILCVPLIFVNCLSGDWVSQKLGEHEHNQYKQEMQFESSEDVDKAYDFIMQNIDLTANDGVVIDIQKGENSIIVIYTYDAELTELIKQQGLNESEIFEIINQATATSLEIQKWVKEYTGIDIDIETKIYDSEGHLYAHSINDELIEMNPVSPTSGSKETVKEEKKETKQELKGRCCMCGTPVADTSPSAYCDKCAAEKDAQWEEENMNNCQNCGEMFLKWELQAYGEYGRLCPGCYESMTAKSNCMYCRKEISASDGNQICEECEYESWSWHCTHCGDALTQSEYDMDTGQCAECREKTGYTPEPEPPAPNGRCPVDNGRLEPGQTYCSPECENFANGMYN